MRSMMRSLAAGCALMSLAVVPATGQSVKNIGFLVGVDFSTFVGSDANLNSVGFDKGSLTGFLGGVFVDVPLGASVMLEPSAMYIGKGAKYSIS
jgi:hypothetical protein